MSSGSRRRRAAEKRIVIISAADTRCDQRIRRTVTSEKSLLPNQGKPAPDASLRVFPQAAGFDPSSLEPASAVRNVLQSSGARVPAHMAHTIPEASKHMGRLYPGRAGVPRSQGAQSAIGPPTRGFDPGSPPSPRPRSLARPDGKHERGNQHESAVDEESNLVTPNINQGAQSHRSQHEPQVPDRAI